MNFKQLFRSDDRAVSPVLGVALLIAITVILAGVVAFVVLGVDANNADAPSASLDFAENATATGVEVKHTGGATLNASVVSYKINGGTAVDLPSDLSTGAKVTVPATSGDEIAIVWNDPNSDREVLLADYVVE